MRFFQIFGFLCCMGLASVALAQEEQPDTSTETSEESKRITRIDLGEIRVTGQARGPAAFYVLQTPTLSYPEVKLRKSFLGKVVDSVKKTPDFSKK